VGNQLGKARPMTGRVDYHHGGGNDTRRSVGTISQQNNNTAAEYNLRTRNNGSQFASNPAFN